MSNPELHNLYGRERISDRQVDELTGLARGLCADGVINQAEVEFLYKWLAANADITGHPIIGRLYGRVHEILADGIADQVECQELFETLQSFSGNAFEVGEALKPTSLPLCNPAPDLGFPDTAYCFTGTFSFGRRQDCKNAIIERGGSVGSLTRKTDVLVIGAYATESWKHSAFGHKVMKAVEMRDTGIPVAIVSEEHWVRFL